MISAARSGPADRGGERQRAVVQVHAVGDQLADHARRAEQGEDRAGLAVVRRAHAVEQVGADGRAGRAPRPCVWSYVASVCPIAATTPCATSSRIASSAPGRSGAMVTIRTAPSPSSISSAELVERRVAQELRVLRTAPHLPTGTAPRSGRRRAPPPSTSGANAAVASRISSNGELTRLASMVVVPWREVEVGRPPGRVGVPGGEGVPAAAVAVDVDEARHDPVAVPDRRVLGDRGDPLAVDLHTALPDDPGRGDHPASYAIRHESPTCQGCRVRLRGCRGRAARRRGSRPRRRARPAPVAVRGGRSAGRAGPRAAGRAARRRPRPVRRRSPPPPGRRAPGRSAARRRARRRSPARPGWPASRRPPPGGPPRRRSPARRPVRRSGGRPRRPRRPPPGSRPGRSRSAARPGRTTMCPISPAAPCAPTNAVPSIRSAAAMPVPMATKSTCRPSWPAPIRASAMPPARTSWPSAAGRPSRSVTRSRSGTSRKPTFADQTATPAASSTTPGTAMPTATGVSPSARARSARPSATSRMVRTTASGPRSAPVACRSVWWTGAVRSTRAHFMPVPPTSRAITTADRASVAAPVTSAPRSG